MNDITKFSQICRKIVCVGRNYRDHALELKNPIPSEPLLFLKPPSTFISEGENIRIPTRCKALHHEVELAVIIGKDGRNINKDVAEEYIAGYALGLDMTARDLQDDIKKKGHPWLLAKCWDTFCPISEFIPKSLIKNPHDLNLWLKVDNELKQSGSTKDMIFTIPDIISFASNIMTLQRGDVILTGTPKGVGAVTSGQVIDCGIEGLKQMSFKVE